MYMIGLELKYFNAVVTEHFNNNSGRMLPEAGNSDEKTLACSRDTAKFRNNDRGCIQQQDVRCNQK
jgi:hypothetical protein